MKNKVIFIGAIDKGNVATNGETMKNQMLLRRFEALFDKVIAVDAYQWKKRPWCFLLILWVLIGNRGAKVVVSASGAASHLFSFLYYVPLKKNVYEWVIGGNRAEKIRQGVYSVKVLKWLKKIIVEGNSMVQELSSLGLENVVCVPNFKPVDYLAPVKKSNSDFYKFVFLSRVHPAKGVNEIVEACAYLNKNGYKNNFIVDFYGPFDTDYKQHFESLINHFPNVNYRGFLNLMDDNKGYEKLSEYDVMLFPTYWDGEGFPGIAIDAYMSALPIIASDWSMNKEVVEDGVTGFIIPVHDSKALALRMKAFLDKKYNLKVLSKNCIERAKGYDYRNVVTKDLLINLGLLE